MSSNIVKLNVGGTFFTTSISTLISHSSYFDAMFSQNWSCNTHNDDETNDCSDTSITKEQNFPTIFIDKDPIPFSYIMTYMREGRINLSDDYMIARLIILQAQYFGIECLLCKIKFRAVKNCMYCETNVFNITVVDDDDEQDVHATNVQNNDQEKEQKQLLRYGQAFDQKYQTLHDAFEDGCLPYAYFQKYRNQLNVQVGQEGVKFFINKTKAVEKSDFFKEVVQGGPTFPIAPAHSIYIDQDPDVFKYIHDYIRYSQINLPSDNPSLFRRILCCAEDLRLKDFIILVKARTMAGLEFSEAPMGADPMFLYDSLHATVVDISNNQRHHASLFDQKYSSIDAAFTEGVLPKMYFRMS